MFHREVIHLGEIKSAAKSTQKGSELLFCEVIAKRILKETHPISSLSQNCLTFTIYLFQISLEDGIFDKFDT